MITGKDEASPHPPAYQLGQDFLQAISFTKSTPRQKWKKGWPFHHEEFLGSSVYSAYTMQGDVWHIRLLSFHSWTSISDSQEKFSRKPRDQAYGHVCLLPWKCMCYPHMHTLTHTFTHTTYIALNTCHHMNMHAQTHTQAPVYIHIPICTHTGTHIHILTWKTNSWLKDITVSQQNRWVGLNIGTSLKL